MKIAQSTVNLVSSHTYYEENTVSVQSGVMTRSSFLENLQNQEKKMDSLEITESGENAIGSETYTSLKPQKSEYLGTMESTLEDQMTRLRTTLLDRILRFLQLLGGDTKGSGYRDMMRQTSSMLTTNMFVKTTTVQMTHIEEESTTFEGKGTALTEDGRSIDFNLSFSLSSRLTEYAGMSVSSAVNMIDPLVINVGNDITHISDQNFFFDLDCDGTEEKISAPGIGSGFLTYDKNGDGKVNDGSELFGVKSGNGFKDLAAYDSDNNNWIDESDDIYDKLKIWLRNEDGTDTLMSLKEADVGAIYLGSAATEFAERNSSLVMAGMLRSSGIFLRESGGVGTIQQLDLAAL
jgi:hypothetical protein